MCWLAKKKLSITAIYIDRSISHTRRYNNLNEVSEDLGCQPNRKAVTARCRKLKYERVEFVFEDDTSDEINLIKED